jgi:pilus assembly protein Flp/PilA
MVQRTTVVAAARAEAASTGVELRVSPAVTSKATTPGPRREAINDMQYLPRRCWTYNPSPSVRVAPAEGWSPHCDSAVERRPGGDAERNVAGSLIRYGLVTNRERSRPDNAVMHLVGLIARWMARLIDNERGQSMVEYALILVLIAVVVIVVLIVLGNQVANVFCNISGAIGQ